MYIIKFIKLKIEIRGKLERKAKMSVALLFLILTINSLNSLLFNIAQIVIRVGDETRNKYIEHFQ